MSQYIMRLDDASEYMAVEKWQRMEDLLDKYNIRPIVGVIPNNRDPDMIGVYPKSDMFWKKVHNWKEKGWRIALHGYDHVFVTNEGGLNPVNERSEFAGLPLEKQKEKIRKGYDIFQKHNITPEIFFAPAHTFDANTLTALKEETNIRIISDTIANDIYFQNGFYFIPQQSGRVRALPFRVVTFCCHPNNLTEAAFQEMDTFFEKHTGEFAKTKLCFDKKKKYEIGDKALRWLYFSMRGLKK